MDRTPCQAARRRRKNIMLQKKQRKKSLCTLQHSSVLSSPSKENYSPSGSQNGTPVSVLRGPSRVPFSLLYTGKFF